MRAALRLVVVMAMAIGGLLQLSTSAMAAAVPFTCSPTLYQVSAQSSGGFYKYDAAANAFNRVGTEAISGINAIGYNTADNFIYGVSSGKLYQIDSTGAFSAGTTITGAALPTASGGDFYNGKLLVAGSTNSWAAIDPSTAVATSFPMTAAANGQASSATWSSYDLTVQGTMAYGLKDSTLYIANLQTQQVSSRTITGTTTGDYGAAYSDSAGNAYFYNNGDHKLYLLTAAELAKATTSATSPAAVLVGTGATTTLGGPNDGASCNQAVSAFAPTIVDPASSSSVTTTSATLTGNVIANNSSTTTGFCYGTSATLDGCTSVTGSPATASGASQQQFSSSLTGLTPGTTYYYQIVATNSSGTNTGQIYSFTTAPGEESAADQTITFPALDAMTLGADPQDLAATASSDLPVTYTSLTPTVCSVSGSTVVAVAVGNCTIAADQAGNVDFNAAAQVSRSFAVTAAAQSITFPALRDVTFGDAAPALSATASSGLPVTYTSLTPSVCTVEDGVVSVLAAGTCTIEAAQAGNGTHAAATPVSRSFTVAKAAQTVAIAPIDNVTLDAGPAHAAVTASGPNAATLTSQTPSVCTVGVSGTVNLVSAGTCTLRASVPADDNHTGATADRSFTVLPALTVVQPDPVDVQPGSAISVALPASGGVGPYTWAVDDVADNVLPAGLVLDPATGAITGKVARAGTYSVQIRVTDHEGTSVVRTVAITVARTGTTTAPSGRRSVVAGDGFSLPDSTDPSATWTFTVPAGVTLSSSTAGKRMFTTDPTMSGIVDVTVRVSDANGDAVGHFTVTVSPRAVTKGSYRLASGLATRIVWTPRTGSGVRGYRVYVDGRLVGRTTSAQLSLARPLGPKDRVEVRTVGNDGLLSSSRRLSYSAPSSAAKAVAGLTVHFGTDSATLSASEKRRLTTLAAEVRASGFTHIRVTGYTDSRGSIARNYQLSTRRAKSVQAYLKGKLGSAKLTWSARSEHAPVASNGTASGMAQNRRAVIKVW